MPKRLQGTWEPRKTPVQARSAASVDAILKATIQVLLNAGKERLTTTRVAARAGVSVGTLYQYFPNKSALLRAALQLHMDAIGAALETVCRDRAGSSLDEMVAALVKAFFDAKMKDPKASVALYSVSSDIDGARISREMSQNANRAIVAMLLTAKEKLTTDPELVACMLQAVMAGVSRRILESPSAEMEYEKLSSELMFLVRAYLLARSKAKNS